VKFIDQKRCHIPADTAFVRRKYLDIRYAPQGDWMLPTFYTPDGKWKTEADKDSGPSNYPGMVFTESSEPSADKGPTEGMLLEAQIAEIEAVPNAEAPLSQGNVRDQSSSPFPAPEDTRLLDIYLPNEGDGPFPVIIDIFGGGWYFGRKSSHKLEPALNLLKRGFAVVSINYSMSFQAPFPVQVQEVKAAIRYIRSHAACYHLDPDRIALLGESAGAHYAALAAASSASGKLRDSRWPNSTVSDQVQAVIALYCPADIGMMAEYFKVEEMVRRNAPIISEYGDASSMESVLLGGLSGERQWMDLAANPESYVDRNCPPFLFLSGTKDQVVSIVQTMHFAAKIMHEAGMNKVRFQTVEGAHHDIHDFEKEWIYDLEAEFLRDVMK